MEADSLPAFVETEGSGGSIEAPKPQSPSRQPPSSKRRASADTTIASDPGSGPANGKRPCLFPSRSGEGSRGSREPVSTRTLAAQLELRLESERRAATLAEAVEGEAALSKRAALPPVPGTHVPVRTTATSALVAAYNTRLTPVLFSAHTCARCNYLSGSPEPGPQLCPGNNLAPPHPWQATGHPLWKRHVYESKAVYEGFMVGGKREVRRATLHYPSR